MTNRTDRPDRLRWPRVLLVALLFFVVMVVADAITTRDRTVGTTVLSAAVSTLAFVILWLGAEFLIRRFSRGR
jgi:hypothetical protein